MTPPSLLVDVPERHPARARLCLRGNACRPWIAQRQLLNRWFGGLDWPELTGCNLLFRKPGVMAPMSESARVGVSERAE